MIQLGNECAGTIRRADLQGGVPLLLTTAGALLTQPLQTAQAALVALGAGLDPLAQPSLLFRQLPFQTAVGGSLSSEDFGLAALISRKSARKTA